jgi:hypothetical protein
MDRVVADKTEIIITRQKAEAVVMVSLSEWNSMVESQLHRRTHASRAAVLVDGSAYGLAPSGYASVTDDFTSATQQPVCRELRNCNSELQNSGMLPYPIHPLSGPRVSKAESILERARAKLPQLSLANKSAIGTNAKATELSATP